MGKNKIKKGFTLIELIVVIGIVAGLVAMVVPRMSNFQQYQELDNAVEQLQSHLRIAQNNAAAGVKCGASLNQRSEKWKLLYGANNTYSIRPVCADGLELPATTYKLPAGATISGIKIWSPSGPCDIEDLNASGYSVAFDNIKATTSYIRRPSATCTPPENDYLKMQTTISLKSNLSQKVYLLVEKGGAIYIAK